MKHSHDEFWEKMQPAYPISKWERKIPIATGLEKFEHVNFKELIVNLDEIMQSIFEKKEEAIKLCEEGYHPLFTDMYENHNTGVVRFDCMFNQNNDLKVVEANTNRPDWLLMHDVTYNVLSNNESNIHLKQFLSWFDKNETICILYEDHFFKDPHYLEHEKLIESWYNSHIAVFDDLDFRDGDVFLNWESIDVVRLSMNSWRFSGKQFELLKRSGVRFVNTFDLAGFADKSLLLDIDHHMVMQSHILDKNIANKIKNNKDDYVLKPTNLNEWIWVILGVDQTQKDREWFIEENLWNNYLVQEYIDIDTKKVELYMDWEIKEVEMYYDFCPHLFYEKWELVWVWHVLVRYSSNKIVNVLKGGGIGYYCVDWKKI